MSSVPPITPGAPIKEPTGSGTQLRKGVVTGLGLIIVLALFLLSFSSAFANPEPRHIPIAVVAPSIVIHKLDQSAALQARPADSPGQARGWVRDRTVDGAIIWQTPGSLQADVASGAGRSMAADLTSIATALAHDNGARITVVDLAPLGQHDQAGTVEFYTVIFLTIASMLGATLLGRALGPVKDLRRAGGRVVFLLCYTAILSAVFVLVADTGLSALTGSTGGLFLIFWAYAATVCVAISGVAARLGTPASLLLIVLIIVLGNTSAGGPAPRPLLNSFFAALTPILPQGAGLTMIRSVTYFNDGGLGWAGPTLAVWGGLGLLLFAAAVLPPRARRHRARPTFAGTS